MTAITENSIPVTARNTKDEMIAFGLMTALLLVVPLTGVYPFFVMQALCFALLACAFNLLIGYGGLLSFGHAMFLGTAGYITAHALKVWGLTPELAILVGTAGAAGLGIVTGVVAIRRQGIYFSMITLALSQLLYFIYLQTPFTHGEDGIQGIPQGHLFGIFNLANPTILYYVVLAAFLFGFLLIFRTINSPFGEVLKAIRENEQRAISLGYKTDQYKLLAYILSGTLAGFAGSLKVFVAQNASLTDVHWTMSGEIVLMTLVGGLGTVFGPVVGAFVIIAMQQYLAGFGQWVTVIQGVIFVVCVLTFRRGVPYRLHLQNRGRETHEFTAPDFIKSARIRNPKVLNADQTEVVVQPGQAKDFYFVPKTAGRFSLICGDHDWAGMTGGITVE